MTFVWPWMLLSLLVLPVVVGRYRALRRRQDRRRDELAALGLVAVGGGSSDRARRRRRMLPAWLFLGAFTLLLVSLARPQATIAQPHREGTVVLAFDVSASMAADDMAPTRMEAAKKAARTFVQRQPSTVKVGVVAFGGSGLVTQPPTQDRAKVLAAVDRLTPQGDTSLGRGIQTALGAVVGRQVQLREGDQTGSVEAEGPDLGYHGSAAVVLLSDGQNRGDPDPVAVAELASTAGVKVFTIGLGSPQGTVLEVDGFRVATALDEPMLRKIADTTDARYFPAADERELTKVYDAIDVTWVVRAEQVEVTALLAAGAALLLLAGAAMSVLWFGRVV